MFESIAGLEHALTIKRYPDPILKTISTEAPLIEATYTLAEMMVKVMEDKRGLGLAAVQVGLPIRLIVVKLQSGAVIKMANPKIVERKGTPSLKEEGCLSFPGQFTFVRRNTTIIVEYYNLDLNQHVRRSFTHKDAQVVQHEVDHLDGITIPDRLLPGQAEAFKAKFAQSQKAQP